MRRSHAMPAIVAAAALIVAAVLVSQAAWAHCDGLDGPVVTIAKQALETGNVNLVLPWVQAADEATIRQAFDSTMAVRKLSPLAQRLADTYFFETLVRIHRAGEGAPYTGLKPAGRDLGPALPAADKSLDDGSVDPVVKLLQAKVEEGVREHFKSAQHLKSYGANDVPAGREFVEAYVKYIHYVEGIYQATKGSMEGHGAEDAAGAHPGE